MQLIAKAVYVFFQIHKYQLNLQARLQDIDSAASYIYMQIITSNRNYQAIFDPDQFNGDLTYFYMSISAVDVDKTIEKVESYKDKSLRLPKPSGYKILVALPNIEERTEGGIIKPDSVIEKESTAANIGFVMALGPDAYVDKDKFPSGAWCNVGDYVCYGKHTGTKLLYKGVRFILLFDDQITMVVGDPKDLDPTFNLTKGSA